MVCVRWMCVCKACDWCIYHYQACQVSFSFFNTEICGNKKKVFANVFLEEFLVKKHVSADFLGGSLEGVLTLMGLKPLQPVFVFSFLTQLACLIYIICVWCICGRGG